MKEFQRRISINSTVLIGCFVNFVHILRTHFREELKTLVKRYLNLLSIGGKLIFAKIFCSNVLFSVQLQAETFLPPFVKPVKSFVKSYSFRKTCKIVYTRFVKRWYVYIDNCKRKTYLLHHHPHPWN